MNIRIPTNKQEFDKFVSSQNKSQFLQSWNWGEFQSVVGQSIERLVIEDDDKIVGTVMLIVKNIKMGQGYYYCPRGPIFVDELSDEKKKIAFEQLLLQTSKSKNIFLRFEPKDNLASDKFVINQTIDIQPKLTIMLDLDKTEDELLVDMHQKTRYNIRLAQKKGVEIVEGGEADFESFWKLMTDTTQRDVFRAHSRGYYEKMLNSLSGKIGDKENLVFKLYIAKYDGQVIASMLVAFFGDTVTYVHGASGNVNRQVMAPFLLQWQVIKLAKENGYKYYDFYGIDENKWPGVTRFKKGFGGFEESWPGTFDIIFSSAKYYFYEIFRKIRRLF